MRFPKLPNFSIDWLLMIPVFVLIIISLVTLFSIDQEYFKNQLVYFIISLSVFVFFSQINPSILKRYSVPIYVSSLILLIFLLIIGVESRGSVRWITFFGFGIQFSELLKPFLAISLASYLSNIRLYSFKNFILTLALVFPLSLLIFMQPDLGNALVYLGVMLFVLLISGFPYKFFASSFLLFLASFPLFWLFLHDYQKNRILTFINPSHDPLGTSYNAIQAVIAVGSGMMIGKGLGSGTQSHLRFLPENHTDFIFATLSEQLGFLGSFIVILAFAFLLYRIFILFKESDDGFSKYFSLTAFSIIFIHFFINTGMNLGIIPIVGITLPFVSYGGSSLLSNFILLGLLFAITKKRRREVLEIG